MIIAATGHRTGNTRLMRELASQWLRDRQDTIERVYIGMALGFDTAVAQACVNLGIPFTASPSLLRTAYVCR
jgi:hypothetical protein